MKRFAIPLAAAAALALTACAQEADTSAEDAAMADAETADTPGTIVDIAQGSPDFSTLVTAINAAGLGETLAGKGPYTVFAPNSAAFQALPEGSLERLTAPENREQLRSILTYHVVEGETMAQALTTAITEADGPYTIETLNGAQLTAEADDMGGVTLTDAAGNTVNVVQTDIDASNGVIHVIDGVLMPS